MQTTSLRRNCIFKSTAFNTSQPRDYFINECCFGDDLARWLIAQLQMRGIHAESEPGQEDFGWYLRFRIEKTSYDFVLGYRPEEQDQPGEWMCTLERSAGLIGSMFGARNRGIQPEALTALHSVLSTAPEIAQLRWFTDEDYGAEENGKATPN